ncbi:hypothetical protein ACFQ1I_25190 [Kitasatospora arboriphila]
MDDEDLQLIPRTRAESLLAWADAEALPPVPEEAVQQVLTLLELGGAPLHDGWPELGSAVVEQLLHERLHLYVQPEGDPGVYGETVRLLIDHQRAARRLNAKRQERLHAEAEWQGELLGTLLRRPQLLTWPRLYTLLLRADGVDTADTDAVRAWLDGFRALEPEDRAAAYAALVDGGALDPMTGADAALGWGEAHLLSIGMATDGARRLLEYGLMQRSYRNLAALTAQGEPMPYELRGSSRTSSRSWRTSRCGCAGSGPSRGCQPCCSPTTPTWPPNPAPPNWRPTPQPARRSNRGARGHPGKDFSGLDAVGAEPAEGVDGGAAGGGSRGGGGGGDAAGGADRAEDGAALDRAVGDREPVEVAVPDLGAVGQGLDDPVAVGAAQPAEVTVPLPTAVTGVPVAAWKSRPVCRWAQWPPGPYWAPRV